MQFNNQNESDEISSKLLLMLPMVPRLHVEKVKLNHLRLYHSDQTKSDISGIGGVRERKQGNRDMSKSIGDDKSYISSTLK